MLNIRLSALALTLFGLVATLLSGCSSTDSDPTAAWTTEKIYREARDEVSAGGWDRAANLFEKLEGRAAGTPLAQVIPIRKDALLPKYRSRPFTAKDIVETQKLRNRRNNVHESLYRDNLHKKI